MIKISKIIIYYSIRSGFQFGAKTSDNKKPPKKPGDEKKHEMGKIKVKLDKEWTKISQLIDKRKQGGEGGSYKKPKY